MKINGIGVINKKTAIKELGLDRDKEGREALRRGDFSTEEIAGMYKLQKDALMKGLKFCPLRRFCKACDLQKARPYALLLSVKQ